MPSTSPTRPRSALWLSLILFLLLGAILNILLTWSFIALHRWAPGPPHIATFSVTHFDPTPEDWPYAILHDGRKPDQANRHNNLILTQDTGIWNLPQLASKRDVFSCVVVNFGLPFRSLRYRYETGDLPGPGRGPIFFGSWQFQLSAVPARFPFIPIWPGFLLNSLLFASLSWLLLRAPRAIRRTLRKRSNRCLACGYPSAGLNPTTPCPECGQPMTP